MAGPLSGIAGTQVPLSTTFTPGTSAGNTNNQQQAQGAASQGNGQSVDAANTTTQQAPVTQTETTQTNVQDFASQQNEDVVAQSSAQNSGRGSIVDELV